MSTDRLDDAKFAPFDDATLYSFLDGAVDPLTAEAIRASAESMARAEALRREYVRLRTAFDRIDCLETDVLLDHVTGTLSRDSMRAVVAHLEQCPLCSGEAEMLASFREVENELEPETIGERLRRIIATLVSGPGFVGGGQTVELRGGDGEPWIFEAGEALISLVAGVDPELPDRREIAGQVTGVEAAGWTAEVWAAVVEGGDDVEFEVLEGG